MDKEKSVSRFIDGNGDGKIPPNDIGVPVGMNNAKDSVVRRDWDEDGDWDDSDDERAENGGKSRQYGSPKSGGGGGGGCLVPLVAAILIVICIVMVIV
jgi:hypothetical protein